MLTMERNINYVSIYIYIYIYLYIYLHDSANSFQGYINIYIPDKMQPGTNFGKISFPLISQIEPNMIVVTVFQLVVNQTEFCLVRINLLGKHLPVS